MKCRDGDLSGNWEAVKSLVNIMKSRDHTNCNAMQRATVTRWFLCCC